MNTQNLVLVFIILFGYFTHLTVERERYIDKDRYINITSIVLVLCFNEKFPLSSPLIEKECENTNRF